MSNPNSNGVSAQGQAPALEMARWLLKNSFVPVPLNEFGLVLPDGRRSQGKEPHLQIGLKWGKLIWTLDDLIRFYGLHPRAGIGALLDIWVDFDCDGPGAKETLIELLSPDLPDTYGWLASRGEHHAFFKDGRVVELCRRYDKNIFRLGNLECRFNGLGLQLQSALPPTCTNIGTKEDPIPGPPRRRIGARTMATLPDCFFVNFARMWEAQEAAKAKVKPSRPVLPQPSSNGHHEAQEAATDDLDALTPAQEARVAKFLAECDPAIQGEDGSGDAFDTAIKLRCRFPIAREVGFDMFRKYYNHRCLPEWTDKQAWHKIDDAWDHHSYDPRHKVPFAEDGEVDSRYELGLDDLGVTEFVLTKMRNIKWVLDGVAAEGRMTLVAGDGDRGKSQVSLAIAAAVSGATTFPFVGPIAAPKKVLILASEDDRDDTIMPRLVALGADISRFRFVRPQATLRSKEGRTIIVPKSFADLEYWEKVLKMIGDVGMIVADTLPSFMGRGVNDNANNEVRAILEKFCQLLGDHGVALQGVVHFNKAVEVGTPVNKILGSVAYPNFARVIFTACIDGENPGRYLLANPKGNLTSQEKRVTRAYRLVGTEVSNPETGETISTSCVAWEPEPLFITAGQAINSERAMHKRRGPEPVKLKELAEAIVTYLTDRPGRQAHGAVLGHLGERGLIGQLGDDRRWSNARFAYDAVKRVSELVGTDYDIIDTAEDRPGGGKPIRYWTLVGGGEGDPRQATRPPF
jgi:hypothetical protein